MTWRVTFDRGTAFVVGPKSEARRRLAACGDTAPLWVNRRDAWATSPRAANGLLDQLEALSVAVVVEDHAQARLSLDEVPTDPSRLPAPAETQGVLW